MVVYKKFRWQYARAFRGKRLMMSVGKRLTILGDSVGSVTASPFLEFRALKIEDSLNYNIFHKIIHALAH